MRKEQILVHRKYRALYCTRPRMRILASIRFGSHFLREVSHVSQMPKASRAETPYCTLFKYGTANHIDVSNWGGDAYTTRTGCDGLISGRDIRSGGCFFDLCMLIGVLGGISSLV